MTRSQAATRDVGVTGIGLVTPAGIGVEPNWERICAALPTAALDPELAGLPVPISCRVPDFDADALLGQATAGRLDRVSQFALVAAREALADAGLDPDTWDGARVGVVLGNALGGAAAYEEAHAAVREEGPEWISPLVMVQWPINMISGYLAMQCSALGPNLVVATACASGATAIGIARQLLQTGACDVVITGASEAPLTRTPMAAYRQMRALSERVAEPSTASRPFDVDRDGFVAAEGAAVLILERVSDATARHARLRAQVSGYGASADGHHASAPDPTGAGAERAIRAAVSDAGLTLDDVDHVNAHGTSTQLNDLTEGRVIRRLFRSNPAVTSTKGVTGHALGAAGAIEAAYTVLSIERGTIPPTANLDKLDPEIDVDLVIERPPAHRIREIKAATSHSFGFGGQNAVLVITPA